MRRASFDLINRSLSPRDSHSRRQLGANPILFLFFFVSLPMLMHRLLLFSATCSQPLTVAANASEVDRPAQRAARDAQSCRPDERCKSAMGSDTHPDGGCVLKFGQIKCTNAIDLTSAPLAAVAATHAPTGIDAIGAKKKSGPLRDDPDRVGPDKKSSPIKSRQRALSNQQEPSAQKHTPAD